MTDLDVLEARLNAHILVRGELASWKPTIFKLIAAARERDAMREALGGIKWASADRDNMEFAARITYVQMDAIRQALNQEQPA